MFNKFLQIYTKEEKLPSFSNDPYGRSILTEVSNCRLCTEKMTK